jgi:ABC-type branched-subunit amino acid transport system substrate-binding protein
MRLRVLAAFDEANRKDGVHGRLLRLTSHDDCYEPNRSIVETRKLVDEDKAFALIGTVGTPCEPERGADISALFNHNPMVASSHTWTATNITRNAPPAMLNMSRANNNHPAPAMGLY